MQAVRLQKVIAQAGLTSRRKAEALIAQGRVVVNGHTVTTLGTTVDPDTDVVAVDGQRLHPQMPLHYVLLNKPKGYVTTCDDEQGRPTVFDLIKRAPARLFPVGRLDVNTEGVLLLTNDGVLANRLMHPRYQIPRVYIAKVHGVLADRDLEHLRQGVVLDDGKTLPARVDMLRRLETNCTLRLTLFEGRHRQIHRMLAACGPYYVKGLQRVAMGPLALTGLPCGHARYLEAFEVVRLRQVGQERRRSARRPASAALPQPRRQARQKR